MTPMSQERTFRQWVMFLRDPPPDDDPDWLLLVARIGEDPIREQWAILRAFATQQLARASIRQLGQRVLEPLIESEQSNRVRELKASYLAGDQMQEMLAAVTSLRARALIEHAAADPTEYPSLGSHCRTHGCRESCAQATSLRGRWLGYEPGPRPAGPCRGSVAARLRRA